MPALAGPGGYFAMESRTTRRGKSNKNWTSLKPEVPTPEPTLNESPTQRAGFLFLLISSAAINR